MNFNVTDYVLIYTDYLAGPIGENAFTTMKHFENLEHLQLFVEKYKLVEQHRVIHVIGGCKLVNIEGVI